MDDNYTFSIGLVCINEIEDVLSQQSVWNTGNSKKPTVCQLNNKMILTQAPFLLLANLLQCGPLITN